MHHVQPHDHHHAHHHEEEDHSLQLNNCTLIQNGTTSNVICPSLPNNNTHPLGKEAKNFTLSDKDLLHLCPILLYELKAQSGGCIEPAILSDIDTTEELLEAEKDKDIFYGAISDLILRPIHCP